MFSSNTTQALPPIYIEDVFSTYLYTGNNATRTITNGIDLAGKGGLVWTKQRASTNEPHILVDTARGSGKNLSSNTTGAEDVTGSLTAFTSSGYTISNQTVVNGIDPYTYASWTFRKQPKFFDVVTWTGNGTARNISHNLGSVPGCIIVKALNATNNWVVYHRSLGNTDYMYLNTADSTAEVPDYWNDTTPTDTTFRVNTNSAVNADGQSFVAYLFAHNAGGFGLTGTDNVISCGSFDPTSNGSVNLGYEPQWIIAKKATGTGGAWLMWDSMRGWPAGRTVTGLVLRANAENAEAATSGIAPTATGFDYAALGDTWIYIAIRRGPMKVPTTGTSVFATQGSTAPSPPSWHSTNFPVDLGFWKNKINASGDWNWGDRLRGGAVLNSNNTNAEVANTQYKFDYQEGWYSSSALGDNYPSWMFRRAPSFFDEVCYTGTGADPQTVSHNLGVAPELMIFKARDVAAGWRVWGGNMAITSYLALSETSAVVTGSTFFGSTLPTATSFFVGSGLSVSARTIVAYLFATCPGVSRVGSYTGTGTTQLINCGFTGGARFVMIKRTDSTGDWYVWDTARGMVVGNDPYLLLNSTAAEVTSTDYVDTAASGFELSSTAPAAINASGGTYIFLAIA